MHKKLESSILCHRFVNERMMWISIKLAGSIYRFVSVYSPCEGSGVEVMDEFYVNLNDIVCRKGNENVIVLGDLNARVGSNNPLYASVIGKFGENVEANANGKRLLDFCQGSDLVISNTFFKHEPNHILGKSYSKPKDPH